MVISSLESISTLDHVSILYLNMLRLAFLHCFCSCFRGSKHTYIFAKNVCSTQTGENNMLFGIFLKASKRKKKVTEIKQKSWKTKDYMSFTLEKLMFNMHGQTTSFWAISFSFFFFDWITMKHIVSLKGWNNIIFLKWKSFFSFWIGPSSLLLFLVCSMDFYFSYFWTISIVFSILSVIILKWSLDIGFFLIQSLITLK